jgi:hypothetical protein
MCLPEHPSPILFVAIFRITFKHPKTNSSLPLKTKFEERLGQEVEKPPGLDAAVADIMLLAYRSCPLFLAQSLTIFAILTLLG